MDEYIKREAALEICKTEYQNRLRMFDYCGDTVAWNIGGEIKALPAADVAPVVHGRWEPFGGRYYSRKKCSHCGWDGQEWAKFYKYCPYCGARMNGGEE